MANLIEKLNITNFDVEIQNKKNGCELCLSLPSKQIGFISITLSLNLSIKLNDKFKFTYGPFKDFTVATGYFDVNQNESNTTLSYSLPIAFKYLKIKFPEEFDGLGLENKIQDISFFNAERKVSQTGYFKCSDSTINEIWETGARTIKLCMYPNSGSYAFRFVQPKERIDFIENWKGEGENYILVDGCRRDREVWVGDLLPEIRTCLYVFNDYETVRNSLQIFADQQNQSGFIYASSVSAQDYLEYCCWFIICLWEYYFISGDIKFLKKQKTCLSKLLEYIGTKRNNENLITLNKSQTWAWTLSRDGCVTSSNCVQSMAMDCAANCYEEMGESGEKLRDLSDSIKKVIQSNAFDDNKGGFRDVADNSYPYYSLDANSLAVLFNVANPKQKEKSLKFIKEKLYSPYGSKNIYPLEPQNGSNWPHNTEIWPFSVGFELDARFQEKDDANAIELMKRCWGNMVSKNTQTYWEIVDGNTGEFMRKAIFEHQLSDVDRWNSYCHGWSAGVTYSISAYIAGIRPLKPGFKKFIFDPHPCNLEYVESRISAGDKMISVRYKRLDTMQYEAILEVPIGFVASHKGVDYESGIHVIKF